jgi:hypothetical protein
MTVTCTVPAVLHITNASFVWEVVQMEASTKWRELEEEIRENN